MITKQITVRPRPQGGGSGLVPQTPPLEGGVWPLICVVELLNFLGNIPMNDPSFAEVVYSRHNVLHELVSFIFVKPLLLY